MGGLHGMAADVPSRPMGVPSPCRLRSSRAAEISAQMLYGTPLLAVALTILSGFFLFMLHGLRPARSALRAIFISPLVSAATASPNSRSRRRR